MPHLQTLSMFDKYMISFEVESLFTNIPFEECIDRAVNCISKGNPDPKLSESELRSLFTGATAQTHFLFNGFFCDHSLSTVGSPLAPVLQLANLFTSVWDQVYEIVDNTIKFETPVEIKGAVNDQNNITKKVYDFDIQKIDNDYEPIVFYVAI